MKKLQMRKQIRIDGYLTVEAAFWVPGIMFLLLALIWLGCYLYQGCFMTQAAYLAAFRGSQVQGQQAAENAALEQIGMLADRQVLSLGKLQQEAEADMWAVSVTLRQQIPFWTEAGERMIPEQTQKSLYLDPVGYIRGLERLEKLADKGGVSP